MNRLADAALFDDSNRGWGLLFAQEADQDLEFDEGLEDDDLNQHKPPTRRPLLWILLLLIVVGVVYWTMKPDLAKLPELSAPTEAIDPLTTPPADSEHATSISAPTVIPTPKFGEGEIVTLSSNISENSSAMTLTSDSAGLKPGPRVKSGEPLTVIDGETIEQEWVYHVRTATGARGWVFEKHLQKKP